MATSRRDVTPIVALHVQLRLISWLKSEWGLEYIQGFKDAYGDKRYRNVSRQSIAHWEVEALNTSETFFVTKEMSALVAAAAQTMPSDAIHQSDLPCPSGFVYFDQPIPLWEGIDPRDPAARDAIQVRAICWRQSQIMPRDTGTVFKDDRADGTLGRDRGDTSGATDPGVAFTVYVDRDTLADFSFRDDPDERAVHPSIPNTVMYDISGWTFDSVWFPTPYDMTEEEADAGGTTPSIAFFRTMLLAFFRLTFQKIAVPRKESFGRALYRQAARAGLDVPELGTISIVSLRREKRTTDNSIPNPVDWSHRWIVAGHWKNQWYPSLKRHQRIYIHPFVKGPDDKPLAIKDRIYSLER